MNKSLIIVLIGLVSFNAFADGFYGRFWRGEAKKSYPELRNHCDDRHSDCFLELVNRWLIPATPSYAAEKSLMAYAPVLMPESLHKKYQNEIALILYNSQANYDQLRGDESNIEGITYGPIHGDIFESGIRHTMESSRSLVPTIYESKIVLKNSKNPLAEVSYDIKGRKDDIINSFGSFELIERKNMSLAKFVNEAEKLFKKIKNSDNVVGAYALITKKYIMLYKFLRVESKISISTLKPLFSTKLKPIRTIQSNPLLYERIGYGEGANLIFSPGVKPGTVDHPRLHKK